MMFDDIQGQPMTPETVAAAIKEHLDALDAAEPGAAFDDISVVRPLTRQDCEEAMRIVMNRPLRLPEEVHRVGCAKFKRRACDCGAAPLEQIFDEELKRMKAAKGKR